MPTRDDIALIATLNDLLQLEHDALPAYALAISGLRDAKHREAVEAFRQDHLDHMEELTGLIAERGGFPLHLPHLPTGPLKLAVQAAGLPGGDRAVLLAFRANEWQAREKYARVAGEGHEPGEVADFLRRAAADEARHYAWAVETLDAMGLGAGTPFGTANAAFARLHGTVAEGLEAAGRLGLEVLARAALPRA